jgi:hypothetical protein
MCICMRIYIHMCTHTHTHTHTHGSTQKKKNLIHTDWKNTHLFGKAWLKSCQNTQLRTRTYTHALIHKSPSSCKSMAQELQNNTITYAHMRTHTHRFVKYTILEKTWLKNRKKQNHVHIHTYIRACPQIRKIPNSGKKPGAWNAKNAPNIQLSISVKKPATDPSKSRDSSQLPRNWRVSLWYRSFRYVFLIHIYTCVYVSVNRHCLCVHYELRFKGAPQLPRNWRGFPQYCSFEYLLVHFMYVYMYMYAYVFYAHVCVCVHVLYVAFRQKCMFCMCTHNIISISMCRLEYMFCMCR